jgi:hypothetical protein
VAFPSSCILITSVLLGPTLSHPQVIFIPSAEKALTHAGPDIRNKFMGLLLRRAVACELTAIWFLEASAVLESRAEGDRGANCKTTDV